MHPKLYEILTHKEGSLDNEMLAKYLSGELDDAARNALEKQLQAGNEMEQDAWEGWQQAGSNKVLDHANEINKHLERQLNPASGRKRKRPIKDLPVLWLVFGLVIIILLVAWAIITATY
jgi:anti-sigma factor RsiW